MATRRILDGSALLHCLVGKAARNPGLWLPVDRALSLAVSLTGMVPVLLGLWALQAICSDWLPVTGDGLGKGACDV